MLLVIFFLIVIIIMTAKVKIYVLRKLIQEKIKKERR